MRPLISLIIAHSLALFVVAVPGTARADGADENGGTSPAESIRSNPSGQMHSDRSIYLYLSPAYLLLPMAQFGAEVQVDRHIGVALSGGLGTRDAIHIWDVGGQVIGYPVGHFDHGMQLGAQAMYVHADTSRSNDDVKIEGTASGLAVGAFVGYKLATKIGFTFNVQGGIQDLVVSAQARSNDGRSASMGGGSISPLVNANIGWSF